MWGVGGHMDTGLGQRSVWLLLGLAVTVNLPVPNRVRYVLEMEDILKVFLRW